MIYQILGTATGLALILGFLFDVELKAKFLNKEERTKKGKLVINNKKIF